MQQEIEFDQLVRDSYKNKLAELAETNKDKILKTTIYQPDG